MNERLDTAWRWIRRYLDVPTLIGLSVVAYIIFTGDNTVFRSIDYERSIDSLQQRLAAENDTMLYYYDLNERLAGDKDLMEKVVRESYGMKRESEDVYLFE